MQEEKEFRELSFLYEWMRIARSPHQTLRADIKTLFGLIGVTISESEITVLQKSIDPKDTKSKLSKEDLLSCFLVGEQTKRVKEKQVLKAFKYLTKDGDSIDIEELRKCFAEEEINESTTEAIMKELVEYSSSDGKFDYKKFVSGMY